MRTSRSEVLTRAAFLARAEANSDASLESKRLPR